MPLCYSVMLILLPDVHVISLNKTAPANEVCQKFGNQIKHLVPGTSNNSLKQVGIMTTCPPCIYTTLQFHHSREYYSNMIASPKLTLLTWSGIGDLSHFITSKYLVLWYTSLAVLKLFSFENHLIMLSWKEITFIKDTKGRIHLHWRPWLKIED